MFHGILVIDKPKGPTSHDVVAEVRRRLGMKRIGHTGTLDPLATGVLPLCLGRATKAAALLIQGEKSYRVTMRLGITTDTYDAEGKITAEHPIPTDVMEHLQQLLPTFQGKITQTVPPYAAVKVRGKRLYQWAREGRSVPLPQRQVVIHVLALEAIDLPQVTLRVDCEAGTYIRSLVHELGEKLGCGAHVTALRRLRSGAFTLDHALPLEVVSGATVGPHLLPVSSWSSTA